MCSSFLKSVKAFLKVENWDKWHTIYVLQYNIYYSTAKIDMCSCVPINVFQTLPKEIDKEGLILNKRFQLSSQLVHQGCFDGFVEPGFVLVVGESISNDTCTLVFPQIENMSTRLQAFVGGIQHPFPDTRQIAKIEHVMKFGRCR